jgi:hypothetical protein
LLLLLVVGGGWWEMVVGNSATIQKQLRETLILHKLVEIIQSSHSVRLLYHALDAINAACTNNSMYLLYLSLCVHSKTRVINNSLPTS